MNVKAHLLNCWTEIHESHKNGKKQVKQFDIILSTVIVFVNKLVWIFSIVSSWSDFILTCD